MEQTAPMTARGLGACLIIAISLAACEAAASPSVPGPSAVMSVAAPSPTATLGIPTLSPRLPDDALDRTSIGWQMVSPEFDPTTGEVIGHWLSVGTLADQTPTWSTKLIETPWRFDSLAEPQPLVDGPVHGTVVYVADDGTTSTIHAVGIDGTEGPVAGATPHVVLAVRLAHDAQAVYAALVDRDSGKDLGVFALELGGGRSFVAVMPAPAVDRAEGDSIRLAAVQRYLRILRVSADGSMLARLACGEPFGRCILNVTGLPNGPMLTYEPPDGAGELAGIGDGYVLGISTCTTEAEPCGVSARSLNDRSLVELPGFPPGVDGDGGMVLLGFPPPTVESGFFTVYDVSSGESRMAFATDGNVRPVYADGLDFEGVRAEVPPGWVPVWLSWQPSEREFIRQAAAVRLSDGGWVPLELPALTIIGGGHD